MAHGVEFLATLMGEERKKICEKKGFSAFVIDNGTATFKNCTRAEAIASKKKKKESTLYVVADPAKAAMSRP